MELTQQENRKEKFSSLKTWAKLIPFLKPYSRNMAGILILMLVNAGIDISFPLLSGYAVDQFVTPRTSEGLTGFAACLLYTSPSPRDGLLSRMPSSA